MAGDAIADNKGERDANNPLRENAALHSGRVVIGASHRGSQAHLFSHGFFRQNEFCLQRDFV